MPGPLLALRGLYAERRDPCKIGDVRGVTNRRLIGDFFPQCLLPPALYDLFIYLFPPLDIAPAPAGKRIPFPHVVAGASGAAAGTPAPAAEGTRRAERPFVAVAEGVEFFIP